MKTKILFFAIIILLPVIFYLLKPALATYKLETEYPEIISGVQATNKLNDYLRYIYVYGLALLGLTAFGALVLGGLMYMTADSLTSAEEAKKWIWGAIAGLLLGLSAYLILNTINPDLLKLKLPGLEKVSQQGGKPRTILDVEIRGIDEQLARSQLAQANIGVKAECPLGQSVNCVKLEGVKQTTLNEVITLKNKCGCEVFITGGTEKGPHTSGPKGHEAGFKVDLRFNDSLDNYITQNFEKISPRSDGAELYFNPQTKSTYAKENDHWDVFVEPLNL